MGADHPALVPALFVAVRQSQGLYPVWKAARVNPIETLYYE